MWLDLFHARINRLNNGEWFMKWITALDLEQWAKRLDARAVFPGLIGDLIRASASDIRSFRFASGDKAQIRGFDGRLESNGAPPFVPEGKSIWGCKPKPQIAARCEQRSTQASDSACERHCAALGKSG